MEDSEREDFRGAIRGLDQEITRHKARVGNLLCAMKEIDRDITDAFRPGSPDTFMTLVGRMRKYRNLIRAAIEKTEGR